jgi:hydrogenase-4 component B
MMASLLLGLTLLWPLLLMLRNPLWLVMEQGALQRPGPRPMLLDAWWVTAPVPALLLTLWPGEVQLHMQGWLLGAQWQLDDSRRPWLLFSAMLWALAGLYARGYLVTEQQAAESGDGDAFRRLLGFAMLWPLTLVGNLLLILAEDIPSFYLGFALMTFAAYGLVVHAGNRDAHLGGRAYLIMAVLGEGMILGGLLWAAGTVQVLTLTELRAGLATAEQGAWMAALLWLGFGVKAGVIGLHVWLPLAHPVAPTPASAVLSGVMIKAGLIGWLNTLPLGADGLETLGAVVIVMGLAAALGAAGYGVSQRHPKAVLAYSSVSQMGMITALVGAGMAAPVLWPALLVAVTLFAVHHGLTKGALFLGVGISEHPPRLPAWLLWVLLALPALSLAGAMTSGLATKWAFKELLYEGGHAMLVTWLSMAAVGTTLLMFRALWRQWQERGVYSIPMASCMPLAWLACVVAAVSVPLWIPLAGEHPNWPPLDEWPGLLWPASLGLVLAGLVALVTLRANRSWQFARRLMPGDLWWGYLRLVRQALGWLHGLGLALERRGSRWRSRLLEWESRATALASGLTRFERTFRRLAVPLMVGVAVLLLVGLWLG